MSAKSDLSSMLFRQSHQIRLGFVSEHIVLVHVRKILTRTHTNKTRLLVDTVDTFIRNDSIKVPIKSERGNSRPSCHGEPTLSSMDCEPDVSKHRHHVS